MENSETPKVYEGTTLERIRQRPAMYLGKNSLSAFRSYMDGYYSAHIELGVESPGLLPKDIHDWVAYRLHFLESTSGYANMILKHTPDEAQGLTRFFELLDEHRARQPKLVAKIRRHPQDYKVRQQTKGIDGKFSDWYEIPTAEEVSIVVFTDDPGFFVINEDPAVDEPRRSSFCHTLSWLHVPYCPNHEFMTIYDHEQYDRLVREDQAYRLDMPARIEANKQKRQEQQGKIN
jgi:hypothetical protein